MVGEGEGKGVEEDCEGGGRVGGRQARDASSLTTKLISISIPQDRISMEASAICFTARVGRLLLSS